eukprot:TRINITY_DN5875_c2_g1_i1.p1 TRINITY_DN5875_c2_g1~~TRINITY_DN5875_c2_g1_i1.p1  ORF type:complete len:200 (+),score=61.90 TRINITY_DN5875_c2_g1_i1:63-662(+)
MEEFLASRKKFGTGETIRQDWEERQVVEEEPAADNNNDNGKLTELEKVVGEVPTQKSFGSIPAMESRPGDDKPSKAMAETEEVEMYKLAADKNADDLHYHLELEAARLKKEQELKKIINAEVKQFEKEVEEKQTEEAKKLMKARLERSVFTNNMGSNSESNDATTAVGIAPVTQKKKRKKKTDKKAKKEPKPVGLDLDY